MTRPPRVARRAADMTASRGISTSAGVGIVSLVANVLLVPLIIGTVGAAPYGFWLTLSMTAVLLHYSDFGVGSAIIHFSSRVRGGAEVRPVGQLLGGGLLWNALITTAAVTIFVIAAMLIRDSSLPPSDLTRSDVDQLIGLGVLATATLVIRPFSSALTGAGLLPLERRSFMIGVVVRVVGTVIACLSTGSIIWLAAAEVTALVTPHLVSWAVIRRRRIAAGSCSFKEARASARLLLSFGIRSFGVSAIGALLMQSGTIMAGLLLGPASATYFNAAFRIYTSARQLLTWVTEPFRTVLSRQYAHDSHTAASTTNGLGLVVLTASSLVGGAASLLAPLLCLVWLGPAVPTDAVGAATAVLLAGLILNAVHLPLAPSGDAAGRPGLFLLPQGVWLLSFWALVVPLSDRWGIVGIALSMSLPLVLVEPLYLYLARSRLDFDLRVWWHDSLRRPLAATILSTVAAIVTLVVLDDVNRRNLALSGLIYALVFLAYLLYIRGTFITDAKRIVEVEL